MFAGGLFSPGVFRTRVFDKLPIPVAGGSLFKTGVFNSSLWETGTFGASTIPAPTLDSGGGGGGGGEPRGHTIPLGPLTREARRRIEEEELIALL